MACSRRWAKATARSRSAASFKTAASLKTATSLGVVLLSACSTTPSTSSAREANSAASASDAGARDDERGSAPSAHSGADTPSGAIKAANSASDTEQWSTNFTTASGPVSDTADASSGAGSEVSGDDTPSNEPEVSFANGSRFVIARGEFPQLVVVNAPGNLQSHRFAELDTVEKRGRLQLADGLGYPRQMRLRFDLQFLQLADCMLVGGLYEVEAVDVEQDVSGVGAHLSLEKESSEYTLIHDGPGNHRINVSGKYVFDEATGLGTTNCPAIDPGRTEIPFPFTLDVAVTAVASVTATPPPECGDEPFMVSGRDYPAYDIYAVDAEGVRISAQNVPRPPTDVIIETEGPAELAHESWLQNRGVVTTSGQQLVRVSTQFGTLYTYPLVPFSAIDGWDVRYWYSLNHLSTAVLLEPHRDEPATCLGPRVGAVVAVTSGARTMCGSLMPEDFSFDWRTPNVCVPRAVAAVFPLGPPGDIAEFQDRTGTCEFDLSLPQANGGAGLMSRFVGVYAGE